MEGIMKIARVVLLVALIWPIASCSRPIDFAAEKAAIQALFERHRIALEGENLEAVKKTFDQTSPIIVMFGEGQPMAEWTTIERAYKDWFAAADEIRMVDQCVQVRVHPSGTAAWATYLTDEKETVNGIRTAERVRGTFGLEKHGQNWVVVQAHWSVPSVSR
jgi:ketosteroid isomerase-like protein